MFETFKDIIEEDEKYFKDFLDNSLYYGSYLQGIFEDKINCKLNFKKLLKIWEDDWREPLTIPQYMLFHILLNARIKGHFYLKKQLFSISRDMTRRQYSHNLDNLEKKGYISIKVKYRMIKRRYHHICNFTSRVWIYCLDPKGNILNRENNYDRK